MAVDFARASLGLEGFPVSAVPVATDSNERGGLHSEEVVRFA
jgi:hypothetical protein